MFNYFISCNAVHTLPGLSWTDLGYKALQGLKGEKAIKQSID